MGKGLTFELEVKAALEAEILRGTYGLMPLRTKVLHHRRYPSLKGRHVTTDVSIEVYPEQLQTPWLVWVWECKDYEHAVPISDLREFHTILEEIGCHTVKGAVICRGGYQSGAMEVAAMWDILLARLQNGRIETVYDPGRPLTMGRVGSPQPTMDVPDPMRTSFVTAISQGSSTGVFDEFVSQVYEPIIRAEAAMLKGYSLPTFEVVTSAMKSSPTGLEPSWKIRHISGDNPGTIQWRYCTSRFRMDWRQMAVLDLPRTRIGENIDLMGNLSGADRLGEDELGLEIRFHWREKWRYELHRWNLQRRGEKQVWDIGPEIIPPRCWDE